MAQAGTDQYRMRYDIDIYSDNLMLSESELRAKKIKDDTIRRILRLRDIYNYMLRNPLKKDREYVDYIIANSANLGDGQTVKKRTAYEDLEILHAIVGTLQQCSKEWHRWRLVNMINEGMAIAVRKQDPGAIAKLANVYGKYTQLDKNDEKDARFDEIPKITFTMDVAVLGFKPIPNVGKVIDQLIAKYNGSAYEDIAEDADIVEEIKEETKELENKDNGTTGTVSE